ncbi:MAG: SPASM domain-containing protein [Deltaproteobacteria bacterium]|nr:SPASM domain-containing protein [Deltaproteobacteria bacterium]
MNDSDLLDAPVRLTWDIPDNGRGLTGPELLTVARRIADAQVFYVTLEGAPLAHAAFKDFSGILKASHCKIFVACRGTSKELIRLPQVTDLIDQLLLDLSGYIDSDELDHKSLDKMIGDLRALDVDPTLSLVPLKQNLKYIPEIISYCASRLIPCFRLPNADIGDSFRKYSKVDLPTWEDLLGFRDYWVGQNQLKQQPKLEIHDRFIWEMMTPDIEQSRAAYIGCQAANSLGHIDIFGRIHPCAAWPTVLGSLLQDELFDIWDSPQRLRVRDQIAATPNECSGCDDWSCCFGGCRGLSISLHPDGQGRDLMCKGSR